MQKLKDWREVIDTDFPPMGPITEETIRNSIQMAQRGYRADMRTATGRIYKTKEYEARRQKVLSTPLP